MCEPLSDLLANQYPAWIQGLAARPGVARNFALFVLGWKYKLIVTAQRLPGSWLVVLLEALFRPGRRGVVFLEFMPAPERGPRWRRLVRRVLRRLVMKPALRRGMRVGHVLTEWEKNHYATIYGLPEERFECLQWPLLRETDRAPVFDRPVASRVVSSGRFGCDWETLVRAAQTRNWDLIVVCSRSDLPLVRSLSERVGATVVCDISLEEHQKLLESAAVYVISLREDLVSCGQIRVMNAIRAGVPIVATGIRGLDGYLADGETALVVNPGDSLAMRGAVEGLLFRPDARRELATRAFERAAARTFERYLADVRSLVLRHLDIAASG